MASELRAPLRSHQRSKSSHSLDKLHDSSRKAPGNEDTIDRDRLAQRPEPRNAIDEVTEAFVRRTLCAHHLRSSTGDGVKGGSTQQQQLEDLLPPLTSSNDVDLQLYALISIIIKEFVQTWYTKITPDHDFVDEVVQIIAHCTRGLEERLRKIDLEALLLDKIPGLLEDHVEACRAAQTVQDRNVRLASNAQAVYHSLRPHPAMSRAPNESEVSPGDQVDNEAAWRQLLCESVLSLLLPPEDLQNPCLRVLVNEIFAEMIIGNGIGGKACEGWLIWDGITKSLRTAHDKGEEIIKQAESPTIGRLEHFGLVTPAQDPSAPHTPRVSSLSDSMSRVFWEVIRVIILVAVILRTAFIAYAKSASLPQRIAESDHVSIGGSILVEDRSPYDSTFSLETSQPVAKRPILDMSAWSMPFWLLSLDERMPWITGALSLLQYYLLNGPGKVCSTNGRLDRLLSHHIQTSILNPRLLPLLLLNIRTTLFPNNTLAPGRVTPTPAEQIAIKRACALAIVDATPAAVRKVYFGTDDREDMARQTEKVLLDVFADTYMNKHLVYSIVDLVVCRLFPEMESSGVAALLEEKLG